MVGHAFNSSTPETQAGLQSLFQDSRGYSGKTSLKGVKKGRNCSSQGRSYGSKVQSLPVVERLWVPLSKTKEKETYPRSKTGSRENRVTGPEPWASNPEVPASCEGQSAVSSQQRGRELPEGYTSSGLMQRGLGSVLLLQAEKRRALGTRPA